MRSDRALPVAALRQQQPCAQDVLFRRAELNGCSDCASDRLARLLVDVAAVARRRSAHRDVLPDSNGAGIGGDFFEAAALPVGLSHQPLTAAIRIP